MDRRLAKVGMAFTRQLLLTRPYTVTSIQIQELALNFITFRSFFGGGVILRLPKFL